MHIRRISDNWVLLWYTAAARGIEVGKVNFAGFVLSDELSFKEQLTATSQRNRCISVCSRTEESQRWALNKKNSISIIIF